MKNYGETISSTNVQEFMEDLRTKMKAGYELDDIWWDKVKVFWGTKILYCARVVRGPVQHPVKRWKEYLKPITAEELDGWRDQ